MEINGKSKGFWGKDDKWYLERCLSCAEGEHGRENWGPAVASGSCAWCGYKPNTPTKG